MAKLTTPKMKASDLYRSNNKHLRTTRQVIAERLIAQSKEFVIKPTDPALKLQHPNSSALKST